MEVLKRNAQVPLARLRLPGDFKARQAEPRVRSRSVSIETSFLMHEPIVRQRDWALVSGVDRVAAVSLLGWVKVPCTLIECSDEELLVIRAQENAERRHEAGREAKVQAIVEQKLAELPPEIPKIQKPKRGRPKTPRGIARAETAKALGVPEAAVRHADYRARKRGAKLVEKGPLETFGLTLSEEFQKTVRSVQESFDRAASHAVAALTALTAVANIEHSFPRPRLERIRHAVQQAGAELRAARPEMLCPYCKGIAEHQDHCKLCFALGFITKSQVSGIPPQFLDTKKLVVMDKFGDTIELPPDETPAGEWSFE
jgi:ParB-like chromosome segregation protein Spo0J